MAPIVNTLPGKPLPLDYFSSRATGAIRYRYAGAQLYFSRPGKRGRLRAWVHCGTCWREAVLVDALEAIAVSRHYYLDDRHPAVRAYVDLWEAVRPRLGPDGLTAAERWERIRREIARTVTPPQGDFEGAILARPKRGWIDTTPVA